jgi:hypothetical protein
MKRLIGALLLLSMSLTVTAASKPRDFKSGKLVEIGTDERLVKGTTARTAIFTVQLGDLVYSARGGRVAGARDIGQGLVVGDPVQVAIEGQKLIMLKPDGKEIKTTIVKRARER